LKRRGFVVHAGGSALAHVGGQGFDHDVGRCGGTVLSTGQVQVMSPTVRKRTSR
jgi:hypothetical protein